MTDDNFADVQYTIEYTLCEHHSSEYGVAKLQSFVGKTENQVDYEIRGCSNCKMNYGEVKS
jgi:hypothetical protein